MNKKAEVDPIIAIESTLRLLAIAKRRAIFKSDQSNLELINRVFSTLEIAIGEPVEMYFSSFVGCGISMSDKDYDLMVVEARKFLEAFEKEKQ